MTCRDYRVDVDYRVCRSSMDSGGSGVSGISRFRRVQGSDFRVWDLDSRVQGLGFRVWV